MTNSIQAPSLGTKLGLWGCKLQSQRLQAAGSKFFGSTLASQNKTESMLQAWALGCKACRARQPEQNWIQAPSSGSKLRLWAASSKLRGSRLDPRSLQVVKSPKTYKSPRQRAVSERSASGSTRRFKFFTTTAIFTTCRATFSNKKWGSIFSPKKTKTLGGVRGGLSKRPHFFLDFFSATFPNTAVLLFLSVKCNRLFC